jgi:hypothetical protein
MKTATKILLVVVGFLLLIDICLHGLLSIQVHPFFREATASITNSISGKPLLILMGHSNSVDSAEDIIMIHRDKEWEPLWAEYDFDHVGKPNMESYFFQGKDVFDITLSSNRPPKYGVYFRGAAKSVTWWLDRGGNGSFTERIFYDTNGVFFKHEIWYNESWQPVDRRNEKNGIVINSQWLQLMFDTNGSWIIKPATNQ